LRWTRRDILKAGGFGLAAAGFCPRFLAGNSSRPPSSPLRDYLLDTSYPFPYDETVFESAERVYNVRKTAGGACRANLHLIFKEGRRLDIRIPVSDRAEGLAAPMSLHAFTGVEGTLDVELTGYESRRLHYQVQYREGTGPWKALAPKAFKLPNIDLDRGDEISVILIGDDHTFDDADYEVPPKEMPVKLGGDYVVSFLKGLRTNPGWKGLPPLNSLRNGFTLAQMQRYILAYEDPDFIINLGDTTGLGARHKWPGFNLPTQNLTAADYDAMARTFWLRMRKIFSGVTSCVPFHLCFGNHDGETAWNATRHKSREWRKRLFPMPHDLTYGEGGHPDGNYYAFSWGGDSENRGGTRFVVLDICAFGGTRAPRKPEEWTLGEEQKAWFKKVLAMAKKDWTFACFHHVLGGWPAGPDELSHDLAYGRGPLFEANDYEGLSDPALTEQVELTETARKHGLSAFLYGHDHISYHHKLAKKQGWKECAGVCANSPKYMGEVGWWQMPFWSRFYGSHTLPTPDFWGPPGIVRMTIRKDDVRFDTLVTGETLHSNLPKESRVGMILNSSVLPNMPPVLSVQSSDISLESVEGDAVPASGILEIRNAGGMGMRWTARSAAAWLALAPREGKVWEEPEKVVLAADVSKLDEGNYATRITVESPGTQGSPRDIQVALKVLPPPIFAPIDFSGKLQSREIMGLHRDVIVFTWAPDPRNRRIAGYKLSLLEESGRLTLLATIGSQAGRHILRFVPPGFRAYHFSLVAFDAKGREGPAALTSIRT
jgi:hypothetical protein